MEKELFKEMYNEIQLDREQKSKIWSNLERERAKGYTGARKRFHTPAFASICACIILLIGVPVLAAHPSVIPSLTRAFSALDDTELNLTEEQKEIYAKYGSSLKNEIALDNGVFKMEAIISDEHNICIPFSMEVKKGMLSDVVFNGIKKGKFLGVISRQIEDLSFSFKDNYEPIGGYTVLDRKQLEDGVVTGCYLLSANSGRAIKQGDVLQITSRKQMEEKQKETQKSNKEIMPLIPLLGEVTLPALAKSQKILVEASIQEDFLIDKMRISPLSLTIEGADYLSNEDKLSNCEFLLELKDGSTVKSASIGGSGSRKVWDNNFYIYSEVVLFEAPVNPDDVAGIRIWNDYTSFNLWIPAEY